MTSLGKLIRSLMATSNPPQSPLIRGEVFSSPDKGRLGGVETSNWKWLTCLENQLLRKLKILGIIFEAFWVTVPAHESVSEDFTFLYTRLIVSI